MKKPLVEFSRHGRTGNIFHILAMCQLALKKQRRITEFNDVLEKVHNCGSYEEALKIIGEVVELKEKS